MRYEGNLLMFWKVSQSSSLRVLSVCCPDSREGATAPTTLPKIEKRYIYNIVIFILRGIPPVCILRWGHSWKCSLADFPPFHLGFVAFNFLLSWFLFFYGNSHESDGHNFSWIGIIYKNINPVPYFAMGSRSPTIQWFLPFGLFSVITFVAAFYVWQMDLLRSILDIHSAKGQLLLIHICDCHIIDALFWMCCGICTFHFTHFPHYISQIRHWWFFEPISGHLCSSLVPPIFLPSLVRPFLYLLLIFLKSLAFVSDLRPAHRGVRPIPGSP